MAEINQLFSAFSYGELDPKLHARADFEGYIHGLKTASNVLSMPQGGVTRRWGSRYTATLSSTDWHFTKLYAFVYDDQAVYTLVFEGAKLKIYLENTLVADETTITLTAALYPAAVVRKLYFVQAQNRLIILNQNYAPEQLVRSAMAANIIAGVVAASNYITVTTGLVTGVIVAGAILPITFTTAGTLPTTTPQIATNTLYYARVIDNTHIKVYATPEDAAADVNAYTITAVGAGVSNVIFQNAWVLSNVPFSNLPSFDFDAFATYSAAGFTFTASAVTGTLAAPSTITASAAVFTAAMVGGVFSGNGGISRIITFTDTTHINVITYEDFATTTAFPGRDAFLGEPAWSATRGYPGCGTFFQERLWLGGSRQIPNGIWGSTTFEIFNFNDAESAEPDSAISYYPAAGSSNYIKAMTSSKSLLVHSNTGNYSTPLQAEVPLTPSNFSIVEQNKDGITDVVPQFIDNQIVYVDRSANNLKSMSWDIYQSSYVNTNISLPSSHLVDNPIEMAVFSEPEFTDGYFILVNNISGNLGVFNSLVEQGIRGWTKASTTEQDTDLITGFNGAEDTLIIEDELTVGKVYEVRFTTTATLPVTVPQIVDFVVPPNLFATYFIRPITSTQIRIYLTEQEALENTNWFEVQSGGTGVNYVIPIDQTDLPFNAYYRGVCAGLNRAWTIAERTINGTTSLYLEELDFNYPVDSGKAFSNTVATATLTGLTHLIGQEVQVYADGVFLETILVPGSGTIVLEEEVSDAIVGLQFISMVEFLPVSVPLPTGNTLYQKQHIRTLYVHYYNTVGAKVQAYLIPTQTTQELVLDEPAVPGTGVYAYTPMEGWDGFEYSIRILQDSPLPFTLLGIGYDVEI